MADETRKLLKLFGVAVTDFEAEAEKLAATASQLSADSSKEEVAKLLQAPEATCPCGPDRAGEEEDSTGDRPSSVRNQGSQRRSRAGGCGSTWSSPTRTRSCT